MVALGRALRSLARNVKEISTLVVVVWLWACCLFLLTRGALSAWQRELGWKKLMREPPNCGPSSPHACNLHPSCGAHCGVTFSAATF